METKILWSSSGETLSNIKISIAYLLAFWNWVSSEANTLRKILNMKKTLRQWILLQEVLKLLLRIVHRCNNLVLAFLAHLFSFKKITVPSINRRSIKKLLLYLENNPWNFYFRFLTMYVVTISDFVLPQRAPLHSVD